MVMPQKTIVILFILFVVIIGIFLVATLTTQKEEPAVITSPAATQEPIASHDPAVTKEPAGTQEPAVTEMTLGPWVKVVETIYNKPVRISAFLNEQFGIAGGFSGEGKLRYTEDGGKTWTLNENSGGCIYGLDIVNANIIWVAGRIKGASFSTPGGLRLSRDGGKNLGSTLNFKNNPGEIPMSFVDDKRGWLSQSNKLHETLDGGETWNEISLPDDAGNIKGVGLCDTEGGLKGLFLNSTGTVFSTADSGKTWSSSKLPIDEKYSGMKLGTFESAAAAIRFSDGENGLVAMSLTGKQTVRIVAFRTKDGGATWQDEVVAETMGSLFISPDARYITCCYDYPGKSTLTVYRYDLEMGQ